MSSVIDPRVPVGATNDVKLPIDPPSEAIAITNTGVHVDACFAPSSMDSTGAHVGSASKLDAVIVRTQAKAALTELGWKPAVAHAAVAAAAAAQGTDATLEQLIFESLRRCPVPNV